MDQKGSLVDTNLKIYPSEKLIAFIQTIPVSGDVPLNIRKYIKDNDEVSKNEETEQTNICQIQFTNADIENLNRIKKNFGNDETETNKCTSKDIPFQSKDEETEHNEDDNEEDKSKGTEDKSLKDNSEDKLHLTTLDIDWLYAYITKRKSKGDVNIPYLHELFPGTNIEMPENRVIKRNPVLEARCVKLRAQQDAREYRKMTKGVDNVRMRFPEDSISYQLKQLNRQLIAIGQFIISIFAGFLFGFRGVEWMVGNLDFGVRLLLGVMCALIIALAEIYFLAKKLNEELTMTETIQLGGPPKFANQPGYKVPNTPISESKEHQE